MSLLACENVTLGYENVIVFQNLSFAVGSGDYLCIIGENGSGKSTLVKALLGLKKPLGGVIRADEGLRQTEIGYLPQQTSIQRDFPASVFEVILSGRLNHLGRRPFYTRADRTAAFEQMERMGISGLKNRSYQELSGGQQQRVLLARALCATQKLLLLDEPVAGLDPLATQELYAEILKINREQKITVIMVSHDVREVMKDATHVLYLGNGQNFFGTTLEYLQSDYGTLFVSKDEKDIMTETERPHNAADRREA